MRKLERRAPSEAVTRVSPAGSVPLGLAPAPAGPLRVALVAMRKSETAVAADRAVRAAFSIARADHAGPVLMLFPGAGAHWSREAGPIPMASREHDALAVFEEAPPEGQGTYRACGPDGFSPLSIRQRLASSG